MKSKFVSGEILSGSLGITRTAVWKHIKRLREEGYEIQSVSKRGYKLESSPELFDRSALAINLHTRIFGREIIFLNETDSTNNELKRLAAGGAPEGTVVVAQKQLSGRGRRGRMWSADEGKAITMSILLRPDIAPANIQAVTLAASSAVARAIEPFTGIKPEIKWPNDILLSGKKVCGILTEMTSEPDRILSIIVGIGLNVYQQEEDFSDELKQTATSIVLNSSRPVSRSVLASRILEEFEQLYLDFIQRQSTAKFLDIWRSFSGTIGCDIIIYQGDKTWQAKALDVLDDGSLLVETADGVRQAIASGEISIRKAD
ncbi:MAG: biotin--[acetyl-CoA-carboxylase] ligase [Thermoclostridium sp.]|nr:biotin--[acetyl-CoA-carboxylase] ligase [Thermoclostridium sp.]